MFSKKEYENIILRNDKFTEDTTIALGLVKKYVCKNKLLIVGGMAIDFALRLKGSKLYEDDVLPDYDFYSPNYNIDAYKIAEKLKKAGLSNISVINANHISTMRVRVNYTVVADVTYMPKHIFDNLPFLAYRDIYFIHPHFQLIDQHRALSYPYENPPREVISQRWQKDAVRYDMIYEYYPLKSKDFLYTNISTSGSIINEPIINIKLSDDIIINSIIFNNQCISGFAALLYWEARAKKKGYKNNNISLGNIVEDSGGFIFQIPINSNGISIYSNNIVQLTNEIKKQNPDTIETYYKRFLDKLPHKIILNNTTNFEIFDNNGYMISAYNTDINIYIANLQNIMLYMLTNIILIKNINTDEADTNANIPNNLYIYYIGYITAQSIVKWASDNYKTNAINNTMNNTKKNTINNAKKNIYNDFLPSVDVYGNEEISDSYVNSKRQFLEAINERVPCKLQPTVIFTDSFVNNKIPIKYYKFDPKKSPILQYDGSKTDKYNNRIYL